VCHSHRDTAENRTCHWGFDSANWRAYLQVYEGYGEAEREKHQKALNHFKAMFAPQKRKQVGIATTNEIRNIYRSA
jgi:hypothetical protein